MSQAVKLLDKLKGMKLTSFSFKSFKKNVSNPDDSGIRVTYLTFELLEAIPEVESSNSTYVPLLGRKVHEQAKDVMTVNCRLDIIEKSIDEFTFNEDKEGKLTLDGSYSGDLFLDLSRGKEVWLTDTKFSKMGQDFRNKGKEEKLMSLLGQTNPELLKEYKDKLGKIA